MSYAPSRAVHRRAVIESIVIAVFICSNAGCGAAHGPQPATSAPGSTAARGPLVVEYVVVRKRWVEKVSLDADEGPPATRKARVTELTRRLGDEILSRMRKHAPARAAVADAVDAVLGDRGERAKSDPDRPNAIVIERELVGRVRLPAAAKAALEAFARGAHEGDVLPSPAVDADVVLVARALGTDRGSRTE